MISSTLDFPFASKNSGWAANTPESIIITSTFFPVKLKSILPVLTFITAGASPGQASPCVSTPTLGIAQLVLFSSAILGDEGGALDPDNERYILTSFGNLFVSGRGLG